MDLCLLIVLGKHEQQSGNITEYKLYVEHF